MVRLMLDIADFLKITNVPAQLAAAKTAARFPNKFPLSIPSPNIINIPIIVIKLTIIVVFETGSCRNIYAKPAAKRGEIVIRNSVLATFVFTIAITKEIEETANNKATYSEYFSVSRSYITKFLLIVFILIVKIENIVNVIAIKNPRQNNIVQISAVINVVRSPSGVSTITPQTTINTPFKRGLSLKKIILSGVSSIFFINIKSECLTYAI